MRSFFIFVTSHFLRHVFAKKTRGPHQQHHDQHSKDNGIGQIGGDIGFGQRLNDAQQQPAQERAGNGANAAKDRGGKGFDARHGAGGGGENGIGRAQ